MKTGLFFKPVLALLLSVSSIFCSHATASVYTPGRSGVSEVGGSAYSINIVVPPGTAGMQPQLALSYSSIPGRETVDAGFSRPRSSDEGRGPVGVGFSLSGLSALSRCPATKRDIILDVPIFLAHTGFSHIESQHNENPINADKTKYARQRNSRIDCFGLASSRR